jgi:hypothetical protein
MDAGEILLRRGCLDQRQLDLARERGGESLLDAVIEMGFVNEEDALRAIGDAVGLDFVDLTSIEESGLGQILKDFPQKLIYRQSLFPISRNNGTIVVATSDPFDLYPIDEVSAVTGLTVIPVLASRIEIAKLVKKHLGVGSETVEGLIAQTESDDGVELLDDLDLTARSSPRWPRRRRSSGW